MSTAKRVGVEVAGWLLLVVGIAAIPLPGPGWLIIFAALLVLSQQYEWAARWVAPVRYRALKGAAESVQTWPRIAMATTASLLLAAAGVLWILDPAEPSWWHLPAWTWLPGGLWTGITQIASACLALGMLVWSYRAYHDNPEALAALDGEIDEADEESPVHRSHEA
ncbi:PGPGW domain-containing protein [Nocardioides acrostichi]|uniref:PGPGW domain-containing protein n=1 Tax=Nocardioides acrostichi TaxID=2784339 RepID=A0A930V154_9ACTN|nr:PGPGW domain-containing protein [Nocardioides acrostichi]MBF4163482.1 PGPGW domain-containing protein [Nocardioides acrostichi]